MGLVRWIQASKIKDTIKILDELPSINMLRKFSNNTRLHLLYLSSWTVGWWYILITLVVLLPNMNIQAQPISYQRIDTHVFQTPNQMETSVKMLAAYLVKPTRNEHEKIRAFFIG